VRRRPAQPVEDQPGMTRDGSGWSPWWTCLEQFAWYGPWCLLIPRTPQQRADHPPKEAQ
jgi:hypothetical protein